MRVSNLQSPRSGQPVANQYNISDGDTETFQSYQTVIAKRVGVEFIISNDFNYSRTTSKYFTEWLRAWFNDFEIETIKKWLRKDSTRNGSKLVEVLNRPVNITFVDEL